MRAIESLSHENDTQRAGSGEAAVGLALCAVCARAVVRGLRPVASLGPVRPPSVRVGHRASASPGSGTHRVCGCNRETPACSVVCALRSAWRCDVWQGVGLWALPLPTAKRIQFESETSVYILYASGLFTVSVARGRAGARTGTAGVVCACGLASCARVVDMHMVVEAGAERSELRGRRRLHRSTSVRCSSQPLARSPHTSVTAQ